MKLKIEKEEYINKTFKLNKKLAEEMEKIRRQKNISMNRLVVLSLNYALANLDRGEE